MSKSRFRATAALSAIALAAIGGVLVFAGGRVAMAAMGSATLEDRLAVILDMTDDPIPDFGPVLDERRRWTDVPGVRAQALQEIVMVTALIDASPQTRFEERLDRSLIALLRVEPAAPGYWAVLADLRLDEEAGIEAMAAAFRMSALVERFEAPAMAQRVELGLRTWEILGEGERAIVVGDLVAMRSRLSVEEIDGVAGLTATMDEEAKREVREAIEARLGKDPWIDRLGI